MSFEVPKKLEREINRIVKNYPEKRSASLMVLHALQDEFGGGDPLERGADAAAFELVLEHLPVRLREKQVVGIMLGEDLVEHLTGSLELPTPSTASGESLLDETGDAGDRTKSPSGEFRGVAGLDEVVEESHR